VRLGEDITVSDLEIMTQAPNYQNWMFETLAPYIGRRVVEVGCGIGNFTRFLLKTDLVVALDVHEEALHGLRRRFHDRRNLVPLRLDIQDPAAIELKHKEIDTVICLNVLEHVRDDTLALKHMRELLLPSGHLVLLVPALPSIYGSVDYSLGHFRRYSRHELVNKLTRVGYKVEHVFYFNVVGILGWLVNNRITKRTEESPLQIRFFDRWVVPLVWRVERIVRPPVGLSLIAIARPAI